MNRPQLAILTHPRVRLTSLHTWTAVRVPAKQLSAKPGNRGRGERAQPGNSSVGPIRLGGQDAPDCPTAFPQRQGQAVADVATDELDIRLIGRSMKQTDPQL